MKTDAGQSYISPNVYLAMLLIAMLGLNFLNLPRDAAHTSGPSGYWTIMVALIYAAPFIFLASVFQHRFGSRNLLAIAQAALGKPIAMAGNLLFLLIFFAWLVFAMRDTTELVLTYLLNLTPLWAVLAGILLLICYLAVNGLNAVGRMASFIILLTVGFRLAMQLLAMLGMTRLNLLPAFSAAPLDYLKGGAELANAFLPVAAIFLIYPLLSDGKKLLPATCVAVGAAATIFFLEVLGAIGIFGSRFVQYYTWPNLALIQRINIPYLVLEQVGLLFLIVWLTMFFVGSAFYFTLIAGGLKQQFKALNYRWTTVACVVLVFGGSMAVPNAAYSHNIFMVLRRWLPLPAAGYILLVYILALLRGVKRQDALS